MPPLAAFHSWTPRRFTSRAQSRGYCCELFITAVSGPCRYGIRRHFSVSLCLRGALLISDGGTPSGFARRHQCIRINDSYLQHLLCTVGHNCLSPLCARPRPTPRSPATNTCCAPDTSASSHRAFTLICFLASA